jgi:outer membrane lipoprotein-sorting protein
MRWTIPTLIAITVGTSVGQVTQVSPDDLKAREILKRVAEAYAGCKTYSDKGIVKTVYISAARTRTTELPFTTAYVRPDRFRFEYTQWNPRRAFDNRYIVWRHGGSVKTWWDVRPGVEDRSSLDLALAGATGVSGGSAHTIPALLMPEQVSGWRLTDLNEATRIEDADLNTVSCFRIEGNVRNRAKPCVLWIEKSEFRVIRIDRERDFGDFRTETTTTYHSVFNGRVSDDMLAFDPPE